MQREELFLKKTIGNVLGIMPESINNETSMDNVKEWDSLKHLNLVLAIEHAFDITLTEEQTIEIISFALIKVVLSEHGITFI